MQSRHFKKNMYDKSKWNAQPYGLNVINVDSEFTDASYIVLCDWFAMCILAFPGLIMCIVQCLKSIFMVVLYFDECLSYLHIFIVLLCPHFLILELSIFSIYSSWIVSRRGQFWEVILFFNLLLFILCSKWIPKTSFTDSC